MIYKLMFYLEMLQGVHRCLVTGNAINCHPMVVESPEEP
jgi:hypothetical protein